MAYLHPKKPFSWSRWWGGPYARKHLAMVPGCFWGEGKSQAAELTKISLTFNATPVKVRGQRGSKSALELLHGKRLECGCLSYPQIRRLDRREILTCNLFNFFQEFCVNLGLLNVLDAFAVDVFHRLVAAARRAVITVVGLFVSFFLDCFNGTWP